MDSMEDARPLFPWESRRVILSNGDCISAAHSRLKCVSHGEGMDQGSKLSNVYISSKVNFFAPSGVARHDDSLLAPGGYGGRALSDIAAGETLLELPLSSCLTPLRLKYQPLPEWVDEQQKLMLRLLHELCVVDKSLWGAYFDTLPRDFPSLPLWYREEELALLRGTSVDAFLAGPHIGCEADLLGLLAWIRAHPDVFPPELKLTLEDLRWAASVVASRSFDVSLEGVALVPFGDALNHRSIRPHTRMREVDGGNRLVFVAELDIKAGEEVFNFYGEHSNVQWLLNGGFVESQNPFDSVPITPSEVVSTVLAQLDRCQVRCSAEQSDKEAVSEQGHSSESECDAPYNLCARLAFLQQVGICSPHDAFAVHAHDLLPDSLATLILVLLMDDAAFAAYQQRPPECLMIDIAVEDIDEPVLAGLYRALVQLVDCVDRRYDTTLECDLQLVCSLQLETCNLTVESRAKRARCDTGAPAKQLHNSVRKANARNILQLRVSQRQLLAKLQRMASDCFSPPDKDFDKERGDES